MNIPIKPQKLTYSVTEAAEALGVSKSTMYEFIKIQGFPVIAIGNRRLIPIKGLERWVEEQARKGWSGRYVEQP